MAANRMTHTVEVVDNLLVILDQDGNGCDCHELRGIRSAMNQLRRWQHKYAFDYAAATRIVSDFYSDNAAEVAPRVGVAPAVIKIAKDVLKLPTLEYRHEDALDFHDFSIGQIKLALQAAYEAGRGEHAGQVFQP